MKQNEPYSGEKVWFAEAVLGFYLSWPFPLRYIPSVYVYIIFSVANVVCYGFIYCVCASVGVCVCGEMVDGGLDFILYDVILSDQIRCFYVSK